MPYGFDQGLNAFELDDREHKADNPPGQTSGSATAEKAFENHGSVSFRATQSQPMDPSATAQRPRPMPCRKQRHGRVSHGAAARSRRAR